jgi:hypothetical protein
LYSRITNIQKYIYEVRIIYQLTSPNIKIKVTEMRTATQAVTKESRKIGSAYASQRQGKKSKSYLFLMKDQ